MIHKSGCRRELLQKCDLKSQGCTWSWHWNGVKFWVLPPACDVVSRELREKSPCRKGFLLGHSEPRPLISFCGYSTPWGPAVFGGWRSTGWLLSPWQHCTVKLDWNGEVLWHSVLGYQDDWELGIHLTSQYIVFFSSDPYKEIKVSLFGLLRSGGS